MRVKWELLSAKVPGDLMRIWFLFPRAAIHLQEKKKKKSSKSLGTVVSLVTLCHANLGIVPGLMLASPMSQKCLPSHSILNSSISRCRFTGKAAAGFRSHV